MSMIMGEFLKGDASRIGDNRCPDLHVKMYLQVTSLLIKLDIASKGLFTDIMGQLKQVVLKKVSEYGGIPEVNAAFKNIPQNPKDLKNKYVDGPS